MGIRLVLALGFLAWTLVAPSTTAQGPTAGSGRVVGRVHSTAAGAIADATITLTPLDGAPPALLTTTSDRQGAFAFERLPVGRYRVTAAKPGYTNRRPMAASSERFDTDFLATLSEGAGGSEARVEPTLYRTSSIAGRIAEPDGIPAPDVQVFAAVGRATGYVLLTETRTTTEWDGRYRITGLPPGEYLVVVLPAANADPARLHANAERRAPESSSATRPFFDPTLYPGVTSSQSARPVTVFEGIDVDGIDVWLTPAQRFSISGRVLRPDGTNVENVAIEYANLSAHRSGLWTVPDPGDVFSITGVPQGTVVLLARADSNRGPLAGVVSTSVTTDDVEDLELTLNTPGMVEGRIVYEAGVPPSGRARTVALRQRLLPVSPLYPAPESTIGTDGHFRVTNALGLYEFEMPGASDLRVTRVVHSGREIPDARIRVSAGETITGVEVVVSR